MLLFLLLTSCGAHKGGVSDTILKISNLRNDLSDVSNFAKDTNFYLLASGTSWGDESLGLEFSDGETGLSPAGYFAIEFDPQRILTGNQLNFFNRLDQGIALMCAFVLEFGESLQPGIKTISAEFSDINESCGTKLVSDEVISILGKEAVVSSLDSSLGGYEKQIQIEERSFYFTNNFSSLKFSYAFRNEAGTQGDRFIFFLDKLSGEMRVEMFGLNEEMQAAYRVLKSSGKIYLLGKNSQGSGVKYFTVFDSFSERLALDYDFGVSASSACILNSGLPYLFYSTCVEADTSNYVLSNFSIFMNNDLSSQVNVWTNITPATSLNFSNPAELGSI